LEKTISAMDAGKYVHVFFGHALLLTAREIKEIFPHLEARDMPSTDRDIMILMICGI
jgi:hypothetical protein